MKRLNLLSGILMAIAMTLSFSACSDNNDPAPTPDPDPQPELSDYHFDIFMTIGKHGGMNQGDGTIVKSVNSLTADMEVIDIKNDGVEFRSENNTYSMEAIVKGKYYYQVPNSNDRFTKLQVTGNSIKIVQEQTFVQNTFKVRGYTHAWLDDHTLVIMAANGDADKVIWTKLNADDMRILAGEMAGSAYGELMQSCVMYDADGNLYLAAFTDANDMEQGHLLRIRKGETDFDASYEGYPNADGKLLTIQNLGNGKALVYARNDAAGTAIDSYSHYYSIININTGTQERLSYNGQEIPYSGGRFAQRTAIVDGKAYIGVNTEKANPCIYIYDIATGKVEKGAEIAEGYYFDMLRVVENDK